MSGDHINTGGSAFPVLGRLSDGLTVRDYFAAKALAGMCAGEPGQHLSPTNAALEAYLYADAMLAARSKS